MKNELPTIDIKGKDYVMVKDRVIAFNESYPKGSIVTELIKDDDRVTMKATITPDVDVPNRIFTGYSQAVWGEGMINKTSALENCETSAVGRALGMMGIGVIESLASADEMNKAINDPRSGAKPVTKAPVAPQPTQLTDGDDPFDGLVQDFGGHEVVSAAKENICNDCGSSFVPKPGKEWARQCFSCWKLANPIKK